MEHGSNLTEQVRQRAALHILYRHCQNETRHRIDLADASSSSIRYILLNASKVIAITVIAWHIMVMFM
jgi:hypothetical protein